MTYEISKKVIVLPCWEVFIKQQIIIQQILFFDEDLIADTIASKNKVFAYYFLILTTGYESFAIEIIE